MKGEGDPPATPSFPSQEVRPSDSDGQQENWAGGLRGEYSEVAELRAQVAYWRTNYKILVRIIAEQHEDPALHWLDQIVHTRFSKLL